MRFVPLILFLAATLSAGEPGVWSGSIILENFGFSQSGDFGQERDDVSVALQPEYYLEWGDGRSSFTFEPFIRYDSSDDERSHWDIRELTWLHAADAWELRLGVRKVYWGVTESAHLVDVINQTDLVENLDGEQKLGQPMLNFAWIQDWGTLDLFVLAGFRERTFPGADGRLRTPLPTDTDHVRYESGDEETHVDWAVRYSHSLGAFDFGLSHFAGTSREPLLELGPQGDTLTPYYPLIDQTGLDVQGTFGAWLLKLEATRRSGFGPTAFTALVAGFEYTLFDVGATGLDLGLLTEYLYDERDTAATNPFEDDWFTGFRLAFNDVQSTELLAGVVLDGDGNGSFINVEGSRRVGSDWKIALEYRAFSQIADQDPLAIFANDDHFRLEAGWFF